MLAKFFIDRPVFAWVLAIATMLIGVMAIRSLPIALYPDVAPPTVRVSATYAGASAESLENSVTQILEQQLVGIDGLQSFSSSSSSAGTSSITVTFTQGTNPDTAQIQVQNKIQQAIPRLPSEVQRQGVTVEKAQSDFLMILAIYDETDQASSTDVSDYLVSNVQDPLSRVQGVGGVQVFGSEYAMRIWLDPSKLAAYGLMPSDVNAAVQAQNTQISAGQIGALPAPSGQELNATVTAQSRLRTPEQFENIILRANNAGSKVLLKDVARVELGNESYSIVTRLNGHPASGLAVQLAPGSNALSTAEAVKSLATSLSRGMPAGYKLSFPLDNTDFIKLSVEEVLKTLAEAMVLVVLVMYIFLQNWRATIIPVISIPVVLLGTFGVLWLAGYSINTLTLFGIVLSIGLLVDDTIVVVENVERLMQEKGLSARDATIESMHEINGALIGIGVVLAAVFLPMAFFGGSTGIIYQQFSITIVTSVVLSVIVALILTPALCAVMLKPHAHGERRGFFGWFNRTFDKNLHRYERSVAGILKRPLRFMLIYAALGVVLLVLFQRLPTGFLPSEDQGANLVQFTLPVGASQARTLEVAKDIERAYLEDEKANTNAIFSIVGFGLGGSGQNTGLAFVSLKNWAERDGVENRADSISNRLMARFATARDAQIFALTPPAIQGLGQSGGFSFQLQASPGTSRAQLLQRRNQLLGLAAQEGTLAAVRPGGLEETPQLKIDIDQSKAVASGLSLSDVASTLTSAWGSTYVNDFIDRERVKRVYMQGDGQFRSKPEDLDRWHVRNDAGEMTPFSAFATSHWERGPDSLERFNGLASYLIQGQGAPGVSSGAAMDTIEAVAGKLDAGMTYEWSDLSYQERLSSGQAVWLYAVSILVVFLCLAALYESWSIPLSVLLVIPLGVVGALAAASLRGLENDIYFQVALVTTIGLAARNAILIVEFAEAAERRGATLWDAAIEGARLRLRPILMTSLAFIAGVMPLALSSGAGANSRIAIGTGVIGGTLTATVLAVFFIPLFFVLVRKIALRGRTAAPVQPKKQVQP
ncbi:MAG: efflux RND transporter permease subunit [Burkholderiaceae bacterium]